MSEKFKLVFDGYFGEWVLIDRSVWYKTKNLTYQTHSAAIKAHNKALKPTQNDVLSLRGVA